MAAMVTITHPKTKAEYTCTAVQFDRVWKASGWELKDAPAAEPAKTKTAAAAPAPTSKE